MTALVIARITGDGVPELAEADLREAGRVLLRLDIDRIYGASYLTTPDGQE
jgi:hypothetical protein